VNASIAGALVRDALYQVLDNWVFRVCAVLATLLVALTFVFGFREDEIVLFFGLESWSYEAFLAFLGGGEVDLSALAPGDLQRIAVQATQDLLVDGMVGTVGIFLCIAATGFFVPRMLEKGAADTLFSKPLGRLVLLLARYGTGVTFVMLLSVYVVVGMHVGFLLHSGYSDPAFLWSSLSLVYVFALIFSFSTLIGVLTRSNVATVLLSLILFTANGCVHWMWVQREYATLNEAFGEADDDDGGEWFGNALVGLLNTLHYALPKTGDASILVAKLRESVGLGDAEPPYRDEELELAVVELPEGFEPIPPERRAALADRHPPFEGSELVYAAGFGGTGERALLTVVRRPRRELPYGSQGRTRKENHSSASEALEAWLQERPDVEVASRERQNVGAYSAWRVEWERDVADASGERRHRVRTAVVWYADWIVELQLEVDPAWAGGSRERTRLVERFPGSELQLGDEPGALAARNDPAKAWYEAQLGTDTEWRYSLYFSVGSSLAFAAVMLLASWLSLRRIDF